MDASATRGRTDRGSAAPSTTRSAEAGATEAAATDGAETIDGVRLRLRRAAAAPGAAACSTTTPPPCRGRSEPVLRSSTRCCSSMASATGLTGRTKSSPAACAITSSAAGGDTQPLTELRAGDGNARNEASTEASAAGAAPAAGCRSSHSSMACSNGGALITKLAAEGSPRRLGGLEGSAPLEVRACVSQPQHTAALM